MPRSLPCRLALALALPLLLPRLSHAQPQPRPVKFPTVDHVFLEGKFYPSEKKTDAATVLLLHSIGEDSSKKEWQNLAKELQKGGHAVLAFDFRGHGGSTTVDPGKPSANPNLRQPGFWDQAENKSGVKGFNDAKRKETITYKDFSPKYYVTLVNDIAAAKAFLDERNDEGECNSANLILVGAETGASLGALWINSEAHRYRVLTRKDPVTFLEKTEKKECEGKSVLAAVWLTMSPSASVGVSNASVTSLLKDACKEHKIRIVFVYGKNDSKGKENALAYNKVLAQPKVTKLTGTKSFDDTKLAGSGLLLESLGTPAYISDYVERVLEEKKKGNPWKKRDFVNQEYRWYFPAGRQVVAKPDRQELLNFIRREYLVP